MDLFFDTEFIGFKELEPLSLGFCPIEGILPSAYFEIDVIDPDISRLDEEPQFFMRTEVLSQLGSEHLLGALRGKRIRCQRLSKAALEKSLYDYLNECVTIAASKNEKLWLVSDYDGDFEVLKKFISQEHLNTLGVRQIHVGQLLPDRYAAQHAYFRVLSDLFKQGMRLGSTAKLNRHHAFFDAWVMAQAYKEACRVCGF